MISDSELIQKYKKIASENNLLQQDNQLSFYLNGKEIKNSNNIVSKNVTYKSNKNSIKKTQSGSSIQTNILTIETQIIEGTFVSIEERVGGGLFDPKSQLIFGYPNSFLSLPANNLTIPPCSYNFEEIENGFNLTFSNLNNPFGIVLLDPQNPPIGYIPARVILDYEFKITKAEINGEEIPVISLYPDLPDDDTYQFDNNESVRFEFLCPGVFSTGNPEFDVVKRSGDSIFKRFGLISTDITRFLTEYKFEVQILT